MTINIRKLSRKGCRPCAIISNYLEEIAPQIAELGGVVSEHDVMVERELIDKYGITSVPVIVFERNGVEMTRLNGLVNPQEVLDALEYAKVTK